MVKLICRECQVELTQEEQDFYDCHCERCYLENEDMILHSNIDDIYEEMCDL